MNEENNNNPEQKEDHPVSLTISYPEKSSRLLALATILAFIPKTILLIPHIIVIYVLGIVTLLVAIVAQFAVLFTGHYPKMMFEMVVGLHRWEMRINAYTLGLTDKYPPFRLSE